MDPVQAAHLLRRTEYVVRPARLSALSAGDVTREEAVDDILDVTVPVALPTYLDHDIEGEGYNQWVYATQWWLDRMVDSAKPMLEKMTWFWHGHFCTSWEKVTSTWAMMAQNKLFRDSAFGNFRTLTHAMSLQPAMLYYLDNTDNVASSPNQNFARELMELFTMGVGNYTENDVTAAARAWTGHGVDWQTGLYQFHNYDHDYGNKAFMGVTRNWNGPDIINYLLQENTTKKMVTCKYLTKKLWEFFAYQNPSQAIIDEIAQVLYDNDPIAGTDMSIKAWVKAMLMHDEFYSATAMQGLVRSPVDFVVAVMYHTGFRGDDLNPQWYMDAMGQTPYAPPNVAGWKTNGYWVNTSLFGGRAEFARGATWHLRQNDANNVGWNGNVKRTPTETVDFVAQMFGLDLCTETRNALIDYVTVQRTNEPWVGWWEATNLLTMAMMTPEFHQA